MTRRIFFAADQAAVVEGASEVGHLVIRGELGDVPDIVGDGRRIPRREAKAMQGRQAHHNRRVIARFGVSRDVVVTTRRVRLDEHAVPRGQLDLPIGVLLHRLGQRQARNVEVRHEHVGGHDDSIATPDSGRAEAHVGERRLQRVRVGHRTGVDGEHQ